MNFSGNFLCNVSPPAWTVYCDLIATFEKQDILFHETEFFFRNLFWFGSSLHELLFQGNQNVVDFETVTKDDAFRNSITTGEFVKLSAGYTYYEFENREADTVLVMVHGFSVPSYIWDSTYFAARKQGYGVLRYDVYGRGNSDNPDVIYNAALYSNQLHELLESLHIQKKINLAGLSFGGVIISTFAAQYPVRIQNLIYVDPAGFEKKSFEPYVPVTVSEKEVTDFKQREGYATMAAGQLGDFYDPAPFAGWDTRYEALLKSKGFVRALLSTLKNESSLEKEHRKIAESGMPVYCFWGEYDTVVKLEDASDTMEERIPQLKLLVISDAAHLPHMEQAQKFNALLFDHIVRQVPIQTPDNLQE